MGCSYILKLKDGDKTFNSEYELNEFILINKLAINSNDLQFSNKLGEDTKEILENALNLLEKNNKIIEDKINEGIPVEITKGSVVDFIQSGKDLDGNVLVKPFNIENYKSNQQIAHPDWTEDTFNRIFDSWEESQKVGRWVANIIDSTFRKDFIRFHENKEKLQNEIDRAWEYYNLKIKKSVNKNISNGNITKEVFSDFYVKLLKYKKEILENKNTLKVWTEYKLEDTSGNETGLKGKIDLLRLTKDGTVEIIDFKLTKDNKIDIDRQKAINYQLGFYKRLLETKGIKANKINLSIIPLFYNLETSPEEDIYTLPEKGFKINHIITDFSESNRITIRPTIEQEKNINFKLKIDIKKIKVTSDIEKIIENKKQQMFNNIPIEDEIKIVNFDEEISKRIREYKKETKSGEKTFFFVNDENGNSKHFDSKEKAIELLKKVLDNEKKVSDNLILDIKTKLINSIGTFNKNIELTPISKFKPQKSAELNMQLLVNFSRYINESGWEIVDNDFLNKKNIFMFINKNNKQISYFTLTSQNIHSIINLGEDTIKRTSIWGNFLTDDKVSKDVNYMPASLGNIELINLMNIANEFLKEEELDGFKIADLKVIQLTNNSFKGMQTFTNFNILNKAYSELNSFIKTPVTNLNFSSQEESLIQLFRSIINVDIDNLPKELDKLKNEDKKIRVIYENYLKTANIEIKKTLLIDLINHLQNKYTGNSSDIKLEKQFDIAGDLQRNAMYALAEISKIGLDSYNTEEMSKYGFSFKDFLEKRNFLNGTYVNNTDTLPIAAPIADLIERATLNTHTIFNKYKIKDKNLLDEFRKETNNFNSMALINFNANYFKNFIDNSPENKHLFRFKNPETDNSLNNVEKNFLKNYILEINKIQYKTEEALNKAYLDGSWLNIPLIRASTSSKMAASKSVKQLFSNTDLSADMNSKMLTKEEYYKEQELSLSEMEQMYNTFQMSPEKRAEMLGKYEDPSLEFEINLIQLKDLYVLSDIRKKEFDKVLPIITNAIKILNIVDIVSNKNSAPSIEFLTDYLRAAVFNQDLFEGETKEIYRKLGAIKGATSAVILGANFKSTVRELTVGLITLSTQSLSNSLFDKHKVGISDMTKGYATVFTDAMNQISHYTKLEHLQLEYGINVDLNDLVDRANYYQADMLRMSSNLFWTARAPDFLNRMSILVGYMHKYNCYEAYEYNENTGEVKYNWKKDGRFSLLSGPNTNTPEYNYQKALYNRLKEQLIEENLQIYDKDLGEFRNFTFNDELPRAFTARDIAKVKQESDNLFGYMNHNTKSLYLKTGLFFMFHQFMTFITAKKNQYLLTEGVYKQGHWEQVIDKISGKPLYINRIPTGDGITFKKEITTEVTSEPFVDWKGETVEGIFWSLVDLFNITNPKNLSEAWKNPIKQRNLMIFGSEMGFVLLFMLLSYLITGTMFGQSKEKLSANERLLNNLINSTGSNLGIGPLIGTLNMKSASIEYMRNSVDNILQIATGQKNIMNGALELLPSVKSNFGYYIKDAMK